MEIEDKKEKKHVPRVYLKTITIEKMHNIAEKHGLNRSDVYQEACDLLINIYRFKPYREKFKDFMNKLF